MIRQGDMRAESDRHSIFPEISPQPPRLLTWFSGPPIRISDNRTPEDLHASEHIHAWPALLGDFHAGFLRRSNEEAIGEDLRRSFRSARTQIGSSGLTVGVQRRPSRAASGRRKRVGDPCNASYASATVPDHLRPSPRPSCASIRRKPSHKATRNATKAARDHTVVN